MKKNIEDMTISIGSTIKEAMECINKNGTGMAIVTDEKKKVLGIITDGDLRRGLLEGKTLSFAVRKMMNTNPIIAHQRTPATQLLEIMTEKGIKTIPLVDDDEKVVGIVLLSELKSIPLSNPDITNKEVEIITQVLGSPFLSIGPKVQEFENKIAEYVGVKYAIAVNSGTSGLHLCIKSLGIHEGDEVITTPFSFIASANCILFERARPVFVDIEEDTLCIDSKRIEEKVTEKTKAILPVHVFGCPANMDEIRAIAQKYHLAIIEDAAEALGSEYKGKKAGSFSDVGVFAFYPNKQITTGEGGVVVTNNKDIAHLCRSLRNQGRGEGKEWLSHKRLGYNYRMSELHAALGVAQMERIEEILIRRQKVAERYNERLKDIPQLRIPYVAPHIKVSWFVYVVRLDPERFSKEDRDTIIQELEQRGISCRNYFPPIHLESFYQEMLGTKEGDFPVTERIGRSTIALPFYNSLREEEVDDICKSFVSILGKYL